MITPPEQLSPAGEARRAAILGVALRTVRRRQRGRRLAAAGGVAGVLLIAGVLLRTSLRDLAPGDAAVEPATRLANGAPPAAPGPGAPVIAGDDGAAAGQLTLVTVVPADPTVVTRLAAPAATGSWQRIDDHELLAGVAETGMKAGLVEINGRVLLLASR
jgi:hypothetical protein